MNAIRFFRAVYWDNKLRRPEERRALTGDLRGYLRNRALRPAELVLARRYRREDLPIVFLVGAPRSGTTLLFQLIARHLDVGYVNNFVARYFMAPIYGARRFARLHPGARHSSATWDASFGRAEGLAAPHEFSWFWQFWLDFQGHDDLSERELSRRRFRGLTRELLGLAGWFGRPLVFKSINYTNYQIAWLHRLLPKARFVWIQRDPRYVAQSILRVREQRYDDRRQWWSVRPRDVDAWRGRPPEEQIAHQVGDITRAIAEGLSSIPPADAVTIRYEDLVRAPRAALAAIGACVGADLVDAPALDQLTLKHRNTRVITPREFAALCAALERTQAP